MNIITTAEELNALPIGSVIRCDDGSTWAKEATDVLDSEYVGWAQAGVEDYHDAQWLADWGYVPAAVLYVPEVKA